jgi:hypothetical protein
MQQVGKFLNGERNYVKLWGSTGPLVYPAAHVYIYSGLYKLTDGGTNIRLGQILFAVLYLVMLAVVIACYRSAKVGWLKGRHVADPEGPAIHFPAPGFVKATTQHLCSATIQRLLCDAWSLCCYLSFPEKTVDSWVDSIYSWAWDQDESTSSASWYRPRTVPGLRRKGCTKTAWIYCEFPGN